MPAGGSRHLLVLYPYMLGRWWRATLTIGIFLVVTAGGLAGLPLLLPQVPFLSVQDWRLWIVGGVGGFALLFSVFLISVRRKAYVQPFGDHLRIVTPFLRLNISYRRILRTSPSEMQLLFPPRSSAAWRRNLVRPLARRVVIVLELTAFPISRQALRFFLSPLFFPDETARLALLVPDWMALSAELESRRSRWQDGLRQSQAKP
ncbi:MAG: hypothetical protein FJZ96_10190 [Chloroflexi bacterium]|nr:hypothetical protein [Chloroflexota bacterium]